MASVEKAEAALRVLLRDGQQALDQHARNALVRAGWAFHWQQNGAPIVILEQPGWDAAARVQATTTETANNEQRTRDKHRPRPRLAKA